MRSRETLSPAAAVGRPRQEDCSFLVLGIPKVPSVSQAGDIVPRQLKSGPEAGGGGQVDGSVGKVLKCGHHSSNPQNPPRSQHRGASLSCTGELGTAGAGSPKFRERLRLTQGGNNGGRRNPTPGYITAIDGNVELSPLLWLPSTGVTAWPFSEVLDAGPTETHYRLSSLHSSPAHTPSHSCIVLHSGTQRRGGAPLCFVHLGELPSTQRPRARSPGRVRDKKMAPTQHGLIFAGLPGEHGFASLGSVWWLRRNIRGIGQHSLTAGCCAQSSRAQHFRGD